MKRAFVFILFIFPLSLVLANTINLFSFTTDSQVVLPDTLSKPITIQAQSSFGVPESVSETFDLSLLSSSPTGLFLGSTGKPVSKVVSKNTTNRTFYYKDSSVGNFTITLLAVGRDSKKSFTAIQNIVIGEKVKAEEVTVPKVISKPISNKTQIVEKNPEKTKEVLSTTSPLVSTNTLVFEAPKRMSLISRIFNFIRHLFFEE